MWCNHFGIISSLLSVPSLCVRACQCCCYANVVITCFLFRLIWDRWHVWCDVESKVNECVVINAANKQMLYWLSVFCYCCCCCFCCCYYSIDKIVSGSGSLACIHPLSNLEQRTRGRENASADANINVKVVRMQKSNPSNLKAMGEKEDDDDDELLQLLRLREENIITMLTSVNATWLMRIDLFICLPKNECRLLPFYCAKRVSFAYIMCIYIRYVCLYVYFV